MLQTIWLIMSLRITCTVNAIQYYVRRIPIIKRLFAGKSYDASELKLSFSILAVIWEIIKAFVDKIIYLIAIIILVTWEMDVAELLGCKADFGNTFLHVLIIFTIIGIFINISLWVCILFAAYVIGSKLIATAIEIVGYELTYKRELFNYKNNLNDAASSVEKKIPAVHLRVINLLI